jgi:hypothetical protein
VRRGLIGIAAALALSVAPVVAVAPPALASVHVCTAFGQYCLGASNLNSGTVIVNSSTGRDIILQDQHFTSGGGLEVYRLVFALDTSKCVGFSSTGKAEVRACSGNSNFTNWRNVRVSGTTVWENNSFQDSNCSTGGGDNGNDLTSNNSLGSRLYCSLGNAAGDYIRFTPEPSP